MNFENLLKKNIKNFTVTGTLYEILCAEATAHEKGVDFLGLTSTEIKVGYDKNAKKYGKKPFYSTYVQRHARENDLFEERTGRRYKLHKNMLKGISLDNLKGYQFKIEYYWKHEKDDQKAIIDQIKQGLDIELTEIKAKYKVLVNLIESKLGNSGQNFEILSFAILKTYFGNFGFPLKRFSTTFANDGGMDFIANDTFYQVTANATQNKLISDLGKLQGIPRVLILDVENADLAKIECDDILEVLTKKELICHFLDWLLNKDNKSSLGKNLQKILKTAHFEFSRE
jgi:hypothetical protein